MKPLLPRMLGMYWQAMESARNVTEWRLSPDLWDRFSSTTLERSMSLMGIPVVKDGRLPPNSVYLI